MYLKIVNTQLNCDGNIVFFTFLNPYISDEILKTIGIYRLFYFEPSLNFNVMIS